MSTACLITTFNRPDGLLRTLAAIVALGRPVLVVDDGSYTAEMVIRDVNSPLVELISLPSNRGLAAAMNVGLSYLLADKSIQWISYFQDDVQVDPIVLEAMDVVGHPIERPLVTGHDAKEHNMVGRINVGGIQCKTKESCRATHMHMHRSLCERVMPIPTKELGAPKRLPGQQRGMGSDVDWWITRDAPGGVIKSGRKVVCVPDLVRTFYWQAKDSCWDNTQRMGEDRPLSRSALGEYMKARYGSHKSGYPTKGTPDPRRP